MGIAGVDTHKIKCYGIIEEENKTVYEKEFLNTKEGWKKFLAERIGLKIVIEATSLSEPVYRILEELGADFKVAHPYKVRIIAEASIKTDRIDAKRLVELEKAGLIPEAWVPPIEIRDLRHLLRYRAFLGRIHARIKNRLHMELAREETDTKNLTYKHLENVKNKTVMAEQLYRLLRETNQKIIEIERLIENHHANNENAKIIETIPSCGKYISLLIAAEIGDINRFPSPSKLTSYAGLVPRTYQSGTRMWHGHITKQGNKWLRWALEECIGTHIYRCPTSPVSQYYRRLKKNKGSGKAMIAAARRIFCVMYHMMKEEISFQDYLQRNTLNPS